MRKVKILSYRDPSQLEYRVNEYIAKYPVIDIQFRAFGVDKFERYSVMIIYDEVENDT